jgi:hypothetical protein
MGLALIAMVAWSAISSGQSLAGALPFTLIPVVSSLLALQIFD